MEGPGHLGKLLESDGFEINLIHAKDDVIPATLPDLLVIMGGAQSANDPQNYLRNELSMIRFCTLKKIPILGICLGSQLIAKAFGGNVHPGKVREIGFYDDLELDTSKSVLFEGFSNPFSVFHWHSDTFDLPANAIRLAHSTNYPNQAFKIGTAVGLQFHLEVNPTMINFWLDHTSENIETTIRHEIKQNIETKLPYIQNNMETFYKNFKKEFLL